MQARLASAEGMTAGTPTARRPKGARPSGPPLPGPAGERRGGQLQAPTVQQVQLFCCVLKQAM